MLVVSTSDIISESFVLDRLSDAGFHHVVSESNQWVYIDDFEGPKSIPLKDYYDCIEPLDPRNDGYADLLKTIFVSNGVRRYFITMQGLYPWNSSDTLVRKIDKILVNVKPTVQLYMTNTVVFPWWLIGLVLMSILVYTAFKLGYKKEVLLSIPASLILLPSGHGSILSIGLLVSLQICLGQFQHDILIRYYHNEFDAVRSLIRWYKGSLIYGIVLVMGYFLNAYVFTINWICTIGALVIHPMTGIIVVLLRLFYYHELGHHHFLPIELVGTTKKRIDPVRAIIPFAFGAIGFSIFLLIIPVNPSNNLMNNSISIPLTLDQYQAHLNTQSRFSSTSLHRKTSEGYSYNTFMLDSDGLLSNEKPVPHENTYINLAIPPLESLLLSLNSSSIIDHETIGNVIYLMIVIAGAFILLYRASHGTLLLMYKSGYLDKRIAA